MTDAPYAEPAGRDRLDAAATALAEHGMETLVLPDLAAARKEFDRLVPDGASVYNATSRTLELAGIADDVRFSTRYDAVRRRTETLDPATQMDEFRGHVAAMDVVVGSVHAVTQDGHVVVASAGGSQLASYAFGAKRVVWVVGAQKVVPDLDTAFDRIERHSLPLEIERMRDLFPTPSFVGKQLVVSREMPGRITVLLLEEAVGF